MLKLLKGKNFSSKFFLLEIKIIGGVFNVGLVFKEEMNLMLDKVSDMNTLVDS